MGTGGAVQRDNVRLNGAVSWGQLRKCEVLRNDRCLEVMQRSKTVVWRTSGGKNTILFILDP